MRPTYKYSSYAYNGVAMTDDPTEIIRYLKFVPWLDLSFWVGDARDMSF
jgi:hypothetical protein